jgi:hypothetical protein
VKPLRPARYRVILVLVLITVMGLSKVSPVQANSTTIIAAEGITLTIDFGNGTIREYSNLNGSTVLDVTSSVLDVDVQWFGTLAYVRGIEGLVGEGKNGWQYWVNGQFASVAVNQYVLHNNDTILWKYSAPPQLQQVDPSLVPGILFVLVAGLGFIAIVYIQTSRRQVG